MNDETMDEIAHATMTMNGIVACIMCGELVPGLTRAEAVEDALRLGWGFGNTGRTWTCPGCMDEAEAL